MQGVQRAVADVAMSDIPVLVIGERGSGKRLIASLIHRNSPRSKQPFIEIAASEALPAVFDRLYSQQEETGVLYLNEIAELPTAGQKRLAELLCDSVTANVPRLIASTKQQLEQQVQVNKFREDLYYHISGICVRIPPLRHRKEDIAPLAEFFLEKYSALFGRTATPLSASAMRYLQEHPWPGNVYELEETVKTIAAIGDERVAFAAMKSAGLSRRRGNGDKVSLKDAAKAASRQAEIELITKILSRTRWNRKRAAEELRISYKALLYKLKQLGIDDDIKDEGLMK